MYRLMADLCQPFALGILSSLLLTGWLWRRYRHRGLVVLGVLLLIVALLSTDLVGYPAIGSLEWSYPPRQEPPAEMDVIVVLAGAVRVLDASGEQVELDTASMYRCVHAVDLYRRGGPCPMLLSGGEINDGDPGRTLADAMRDFVIRLGVNTSDILVEDTSRTTYENAVNSHRILKQHNFKHVVLVTDAVHMYRSERCFRALGMEVTPSACNYRAGRFPWTTRSFTPRPAAASKVHDAAHEWLGLVWYRLHGRI